MVSMPAGTVSRPSARVGATGCDLLLGGSAQPEALPPGAFSPLTLTYVGLVSGRV